MSQLSVTDRRNNSISKLINNLTPSWRGYTPGEKNEMNKREITLERIKVCGYKNDQRTAIRLYCENRIGYSAYLQAWRKGCEIKNMELKKEK